MVAGVGCGMKTSYRQLTAFVPSERTRFEEVLTDAGWHWSFLQQEWQKGHRMIVSSSLVDVFKSWRTDGELPDWVTHD